MAKTEDSDLSPSFSCYTSDSLTSMAVAKVIREEQAVEDQEFEFSLTLSEEQVLENGIDSRGWTVLSRDHDIKTKANLFFDDQEDSSSFSSCSSDELENLDSGTYCIWRPMAKSGSSPKCKKSSSTGGFGSKRWAGIRNLLRRSNSDPMVVLTVKEKRISGEVSRVTGRLNSKTNGVHEQFYVQRRAENEMVKRKTYLPYRQDLVGLFANAKGSRKMLPF